MKITRYIMPSASGLNLACMRLRGDSGMLGGRRAAAAPVGCGCSISLRKSGVTGSCGAPVAGENDWES